MTRSNESRKPKPSGTSVTAKIPEEQFKAIEKLDGVLGVGINGVVAHIINSWLYQQEWFVQKVKDRVNGDAKHV